jgi:hypothetical protein
VEERWGKFEGKKKFSSVGELNGWDGNSARV